MQRETTGCSFKLPLGINGSSVSNIDESVKNNYVNVIVQAVSKSNGQLVEEIMKALYSGI